MPDESLLKAYVRFRYEEAPSRKQKILRYACALGDEFQSHHFVALMPRENVTNIETAVAALVRARFLEYAGSDNYLRFRHPILRDAVISIMRREDFRASHLKVAMYLAAFGNRLPLEDIALHFETADAKPLAVQYNARASIWNIEMGAVAQSFENLQRALRLAQAEWELNELDQVKGYVMKAVLRAARQKVEYEGSNNNHAAGAQALKAVFRETQARLASSPPVDITENQRWTADAIIANPHEKKHRTRMQTVIGEKRELLILRNKAELRQRVNERGLDVDPTLFDNFRKFMENRSKAQRRRRLQDISSGSQWGLPDRFSRSFKAAAPGTQQGARVSPGAGATTREKCIVS
eukprot:CAMPEP_0118873736 /NCGR_PEP_ID=MMETSP1163-20130328/15424_1 /TAXON_ID=124430 /ORGANISM="Phaeomonas parva, Strain CCMP2877" /LENGTH=350 /DNA_ID=CAMNT_0006809039 /DNA_START=1 /DNA_END=1053 /DNA_ORIENTATION=+